MIDYLELAKLYGTPLYIYELNKVREAHRALREALPSESILYYSLKANPHLQLVKELRRLGCRAEVSSTGELEIALSAGHQPGECLYTGPGKTSAEIAEALKRGVTWFSVESLGELQKVNNIASSLSVKADVLLRVNVDQPLHGYGLAMGGVASQFGIDASLLMSQPPEIAGSLSTVMRGFHFYTGTQVKSTEDLLENFGMAAQYAAQLSQHFGTEFEMLDLGGGFGHPFAVEGTCPDLTGLKVGLEDILLDSLPEWMSGSPRVAFESGRFLVAGCGTLLCTVQEVKESKGQKFVVLDSGINHLGGMAGLGRLPRPVPSLEVIGQSSGQRIQNVSIVGPLCTPLDCWARGVETWAVKPGDIVAVPNVGAYGLTASLIAFLSRSCPIEITSDDGRIVEVAQQVVKRRSFDLPE